MKKKLLNVMFAAVVAASLAGCSGELSNEYVTVTQYKGLEVPQPTQAEDVTDAQVEQAIEGNLSAASTQEFVTREAQNGDVVNIDYTGYMGSLEQAANSQAMVKLFETLQNTISASPAKFTPVQDLLGGISNSADYALLALIGAGVLKDAMDRDYARPTSAPKPRENKKDDRENDENAQDEQTNETNSRDGEDR